MPSKVDNVHLSGTPNKGLFGATVGFFVGFAAVSLFGPTAKLIDKTLMMTSVQLGLLVAMPNLSGSLLRIPFGAWVDTTGGRKPFLFLLWLSALGMAGLTTLLYTVGPANLTIAHYPVLLLLALLCGCGIATFSVGIGQVSYWFPRNKQGWALGAYAGFGNVAPGLFSYLIPLLIGTLALTGTYVVWLIVLLAGIGLYTFFAPNAYFFQLHRKGGSISRTEAIELAQQKGQEIFPQGGVWDGLLRAAKIWRTWVLVFLYFTTFGGFLALTAWFPTYWQELFQTSLATAGALTMLYSVLASLICVPGGIASDKFGGVPVLFGAMSSTLLGAVLLTLSEGFGMAIAGLLLMGLGMGVANAGVFKLVPHYIAEAVGGGAGWVGGLGALGGFVIPPVLGYFVQVQGVAGYAHGFVVFVGLAVMSLLCLLLLRRSERNARAAALPRKRLDTVAARNLTILVLIGLTAGTYIYAKSLNLNLPGVNQGYAPEQPIAFSHRLHAGDLQIACLYCHSGAEKSRHAGIPSASTCMNCHKNVTAAWEKIQLAEKMAQEHDTPLQVPVSPELKKLYAAVGFDAETMNYRPQAPQQPLVWIRVHNLPDFAYFDHSRHVNGGVACQQCHGPVETMEKVEQVADLTMGWCVNCHRDVNNGRIPELKGRHASISCAVCHY